MFEYPVVFVDIETTGGSFRNSRVLEVAAIRYENGEVVREFNTLLNPESYIPPEITRLTGIRESDTTDAPTFADIAQQLAEIMNGAVFIAHNVRFDYSFLKNEFALCSMNFSPKLLCTVRLSRALYAAHRGHSLAKLIERHSIQVQSRHRALDDARAILYFAHIAHREHGAEVFANAVQRQLKTQYLPSNLDVTEIQNIPNTPGVYIFEDEDHRPLYVGKSITLKKRVLSHFQDTESNKEIKISQNIHHVRTIQTGNELAALILESKLVKELSPVYNRQLRRVTKYAILMREYTESGYATITVKSGNIDIDSDLDNIFGLYENRTKAKKRIEEITRTFDLCPRLMGIESTHRACFSYALGKCKGACAGKESPSHYNDRFEIALERNKLENWPYQSAVTVPIGNDTGVVIENWMVRGFYSADQTDVLEPVESNFDVDEYKIIRRFIRENKHLIRPLQLSLGI